MGRDLARLYPQVASMFESIDSSLGYSLSELMFSGPSSTLAETIHAQPAILAHSHAVSIVLQHHNISLPKVVIGHSVGELYSLLHIGVLPNFIEMVSLARARGHAMGKCTTGTMSALMPITREKADKLMSLCPGIDIGAYNSQSQVVISGETHLVEEAGKVAKSTLGVRRVIPLDVSGAFHSRLMKDSSGEFNSTINKILSNSAKPGYTGISSVSGKFIDSEHWKKDLVTQLTSPVEWVSALETCKTLGISEFIGIGPCKSFHSLTNAPLTCLATMEDIDKFITAQSL